MQLSTLELQLEIQQMLETNPLLEQEDEFEQMDLQENLHSDEHVDSSEDGEQDADYSQAQYEQEVEENLYELSPYDVQEDVAMDPTQASEPDYEDHFTQDSLVYENANTYSDEQSAGQFEQNGTETSLGDYLLEQLNLCKLSQRDLAIGYFLIESLDERGFLSMPVKEIGDAINRYQHNGADLVEEDEILAVLHRIQQFEPSGIAAQDLQDCLLIQLKQLPEHIPYITEAMTLVKRYFNYLASKDLLQLKRKTRFSEEQLSSAIKLIQNLDPNPASKIIQTKTDYIIPDIIIRKHNGKWFAELNESALPKVRINDFYARSIKSVRNTDDRQFLKQNLQEARWFIKSLHSRHDTLLKVATEILKVQEGFFEVGEEAMKPLVLHDIAERVGMHESTISRVTTQKYLHSPRGVFELKYFFSSHVTTEAGGECSSTAIRAHIKKLVAAENRKKPLSDSKIASLLAEQGIQVARRTIAKYRESLSIPPSNERKQLL